MNIQKAHEIKNNTNYYINISLLHESKENQKIIHESKESYIPYFL